MIAPSVTWAFLAVEEVNVQCPRALDNGVARIVGKRFDDAAGVYTPTGAAHVYTLPKRDAAGLRAFFAKAVRRGELRPADKFTAETFGVPFHLPTAGVTSDG